MSSPGTPAKVVISLDLIALVLLILEAAMGPTLLGNLILLALAVVLLLVAALLSLGNLLREAKLINLVLLLSTAFLIGYIVIRVASDSVPMGYGP